MGMQKVVLEEPHPLHFFHGYLWTFLWIQWMSRDHGEDEEFDSYTMIQGGIQTGGSRKEWMRVSWIDTVPCGLACDCQR